MLASDFRQRAIMLAHQQNRTRRRSTLAFLQTLELQQSSCGGARSSNPPPRRRLLVRRGERDPDDGEHEVSGPLVGRPESPKDADDDELTHATTSCSLSDCHQSCAAGPSPAGGDDRRSHDGRAARSRGSARAGAAGDDDTFVTATSRFPSPVAGGMDLGSSPFVIGVATPPRRSWGTGRKAARAVAGRAAARFEDEEDDMLTRQIETWAREAEEAHRRKRLCRDSSCGADDRPEEVGKKQVTPVAAEVYRLGAEGCGDSSDSSQVHVAESCIRLSLAVSLGLLLYC